MPDRDLPKDGNPTGGPALEALRAAVEGTARAWGEDFFPALCKALCRALDVPHALIGEMTPDGKRAAVRAVCWHGRPGDPFIYDLAGTPCDKVLGAGESAFVPCGVAAAFPDDKALTDLRIEAYIGAPLLDHSGRKVGILVVMSDRPIDPTRAPRALVEIFAARAASELERLRLHEQLVHAQRLEAMGRLAASVAHDFNNLVTVIRASAEFAEEELPAGSPARAAIAPVRDATDRAARLTRQLLAFSRRQPTLPRAIDLRREVSGVLALLDRLLAGRVALRTRLDATWPIRFDPGQLEQLIVNLAVNARDASPDGGTIEIAAADLEVGAERAASLGIGPGAYVQLTVADEGAGMDEATRSRCFEPFFSTKGERGTGLGLATCNGIVCQAGGAIWVESALGRGTAVHVLLPRHDGKAAPEPAHAKAPGGSPGRGETILVAEDDLAVQRVARRALEQAGYRVLTAASGEAALSFFVEGAKIDALVTDVVMPGMTGPVLSERARALRPELPILFASGFADEATLASLERLGDPLLMKPYTPDELCRRVRELLA